METASCPVLRGKNCLDKRWPSVAFSCDSRSSSLWSRYVPIDYLLLPLWYGGGVRRLCVSHAPETWFGVGRSEEWSHIFATFFRDFFFGWGCMKSSVHLEFVLWNLFRLIHSWMARQFSRHCLALLYIVWMWSAWQTLNRYDRTIAMSNIVAYAINRKKL